MAHQSTKQTTPRKIPRQWGFVPSYGDYESGVWEQSGTTASGKHKWAMRCCNRKDFEDNDTSRSFQIRSASEDSSIQFVYQKEEDNGRDYATSSESVSVVSAESQNNDNQVCFAVKSSAGRGGHSDHSITGDTPQIRETIRSVLQAMADEEEGVGDVSALLKLFPTMCAQFVRDNRLAEG